MARDHITKIRSDQAGVSKAEQQHQADLAQAEAQANDNDPKNADQIIAQNAGYVDGDGSGTKASDRAGRVSNPKKSDARKEAEKANPGTEENQERNEDSTLRAEDVTKPATEQAQNAAKDKK